MTRDDTLSGDTYERWTDGHFSIARYSSWDGKDGTFFFAYDLNNLSRRINQKPLASFDEALAICQQ